MDRRKFINLGCRTLASLVLLPGLLDLSSGEDFLLEERGIEAAEEVTLTEEDIAAREAMYYSRLDNEEVLCELCSQGCRLSPGESQGYSS